MTPWRVHVLVLIAFAATVSVFFWPLPAHLFTHLTGPPGSDTGTYVWNLWVFRHELIDQGRFPLSTSAIFSASAQRADLSLHNYTIFPDLLALPLIPTLGIVPAFNLIYLGMVVLNAYGMFLLARSITGATIESWLAGVLFGLSPFIVTRSTEHFSLIAAAPLPIFMLLLMRAVRTARARDAAAAGAAVAWAEFCDVYYGVYCIMLAACYLGTTVMHLERASADGQPPRSRRLIDVGIGVAAGIAFMILVSGGGRFEVFGLRVSATTLYTPVLVLVLLVALRLWLTTRLRVVFEAVRLRSADVRLLACAIAVIVIALSPVLYAVGVRIVEGRYVQPAAYWRSSPPGVDLLAFVLPNPNHPWFGSLSRAWLPLSRPRNFVGSVASLSLISLAVVVLAAWRHRRVLPRFWLGTAVLFATLSLGPFLHIGGLNTYVPTPWAVLRYWPLIGAVRAPARFVVLVTMAVAVLFAVTLARLARDHPHRTRLLAAFAAALLFELAPMPRPLYSAEIPSVYRLVAADPRDVAVLELPFGVRDGTFSIGDFTAASQFYQTAHQKPLIGGYLSRVTTRRVLEYRHMPVADVLMTLSEGKSVDTERYERARREAPQFLTRTRVGYVVVDRSRTSPELSRFAIDAFDLQKVAEAGTRELYVPANRLMR